jgi:hypothetical protein
MEDDPALTSMQLWAGRMRADAADALAYGCDGFIGIHWRTKTLQTTVSALAQAGWKIVTSDGLQVTNSAVTSHLSPVTSSEAEANFKRKTRDLPIDDFYADWAFAQFGSGAADSMAKMMTSLDGQEVSINSGGGKKTRLPRQGDWTGPGGVIIDTLTWESVRRIMHLSIGLNPGATRLPGQGTSNVLIIGSIFSNITGLSESSPVHWVKQKDC